MLLAAPCCGPATPPSTYPRPPPVSSIPRELQFATGATSFATPLGVCTVAIVAGLLLQLMSDKQRVLVIFGWVLFAAVLLEALAARDGLTTGTQTTIVLAIVGVTGALVLLLARKIRSLELAWTVSVALIIAAAVAVLDCSLVSALAVLVIGAAFLASAPVVANLTGARATAWAAVPIAAAAVLLIRLLFEFQSPSPLTPTVVYSKNTRPCAVPEPRGFKRLCPTAGYLIAQGEHTTLVAAVDGPRTLTVRQARCKRRLNGILVTLPAQDVVETQTLGREQVTGPGPTIRRTLLDVALGIDSSDFETHGCSAQTSRQDGG